MNTSPSTSEALAQSIQRALEAPDRADLWDEAERVAREAQLPEPLQEAYLAALATPLDRAVADAIGQRAVGFHDEWTTEPDAIDALLDRVLQRVPDAVWAFERRTMLLTVAERWDDLLKLYDHTLAHCEDPERRRALLDEASHVAKDFAGQSERSIGYLEQLFALDPSEGQIARSLERLYERYERHRSLIELWTARLPFLPQEAARSAMVRIATCWLSPIGDAAQALASTEALLEARGDVAEASGLLEKISAASGSAPTVSRRALGLLRNLYSAQSRTDDVVRVLTLSLSVPTDAADLVAVRRELATLLAGLGREREASEHVAALVVLEPADASHREQLKAMVDHTGEHVRLADALGQAADATEDLGLRVALLVQAGDVRSDVLHDGAGAIEHYGRVIATRGETGAPTELLLGVARKLDGLLADAGREAELLDVLEILAPLEPELSARAVVLARAAKIATGQGDFPRALSAWNARLAETPNDAEAIDAVIELLHAGGQWRALIDALQQRAAHRETEAARADHVRIARIWTSELQDTDAAIDAWGRVEREFGGDVETVETLVALLSKLGRWDDVLQRLEQEVRATTDLAREARIYRHIGDVHREALGQRAAAVVAYRNALRASATESGARAGLLALIDDAACRREVVAVLAEAFARAQDWERTLELVEHRLDVTDAAEARAAILMEAAGLRETQAGDASGALAYVARALPLAPTGAQGEAIEGELVRLAGITNAWETTVQARREAIAALAGREEASREARLSYALGEVLEHNLHATGEALAAFTRVAALEPENLDARVAVARTAVAVGQWDAAAAAVIEAARAVGALDPRVVSVIEETLGEGEEGWGAMTSALEAAVAGAEALSAELVRAIETLAATWHRDRRGDADAAEEALKRALGHQPGHTATLRMLADLQRRRPDRALVDTLLTISTAEPEGTDALHEAAAVALAPLADARLARTILATLLERSSVQWNAAPEADGAAALRAEAEWSLHRLVELYAADEDHAGAVTLLIAGSRLPFDQATSHRLRYEAAERAAGPLGDPGRAMQMYASILEEAPGDRTAIGRLARLYEDAGRMGDLLALRQHELPLLDDVTERLAHRLELARIYASLQQRDGEVQALRDNLAESAAHGPSIEGITRVLSAEGRHAELVDLLASQAAEVEVRDPGVARALFSSAAEMAESRLADPLKAIAYHRRVIALGPSPASLDALARLHTARREHAAAVKTLEERLSLATTPERASIVVRLARAHVANGRSDMARACLETLLAREPRATEARALLAELYRAGESWEPLASLLESGDDPTAAVAARVAILREAAEVLSRRLGAAARAVAVLERARALAPDDRGVKMSLAEALRTSGQIDEARTMLDAVVESYGRQRPAERANAHLQLALIAKARGDHKEAMAQLETASAIDMGHAGIFKMLGDLARDSGQFDRAERAYRALLMNVRRHTTLSEGTPGPSEVLFELYGIAERQGQSEKSREILESAFETASRNEVEARRFERTLRAAGAYELLLRAMEGRLSNEEGEQAAATLAEMADVLEGELGRHAEALDARLRALTLSPGWTVLHDSTRALASGIGATGRYADALSAMAHKARESGDVALAGGLSMRLGAVAEEDLDDAARAAVCYADAEGASEVAMDAWRALDRVYGILGDQQGQARVLRKRIDAESDDADVEGQTDALYRLSAIQLGSAETSVRDEGLNWLSWALERDPQYERAGTLLRKAAEAHPEHEAVLVLYDRVARDSANDAMLLDALTRRAELADVPNDALREAVDLAVAAGDMDRAESLLRRTVEVNRLRAGGLGEVVWALVALAERRRAAGDIAGTVQWMREASEVADPTEAFHLGLEVAALAAGSLGDLELAADTYEKLRQRDPTDRTVWEPLLEVYRLLGDNPRLEHLIGETVASVFDRDMRNQLRMERAKILVASPERADDAIATLRDVLDEDPDNHTATEMLSKLFAQSGRGDDLAELLSHQFDAARDRGDVAATVSLGLELTGLLAPSRRSDALDVLRSARSVAPDNEDVLRTLVALHTQEDDPSERAAAMEALVGMKSGAEAAQLAEGAAALWSAAGDEEGYERALALGLRAMPTNTTLAAHLEARYAAVENWAGLASLREVVASHQPDAAARSAGFRAAAALYRTQLNDLGRTAELLARARVETPSDALLLAEHARCLSAMSRHTEAVAEVGGAIDSEICGAGMRVDLLRLCAELKSVGGDEVGAVGDLELAFASNEVVVHELAAALDRLRVSAANANDRALERTAVLKLVATLPKAGKADLGFALLSEWIDREPGDREALGTLAELNAAAERWNDAAAVLQKLLVAEEGDGRVAAAVRLAEVCIKAGSLGAAREGLELAYAGARKHEGLREHLKTLYGEAGMHRELAQLWMDDAEFARDDGARFDRLRKAGEVLLDQTGDPEKAIEVLNQALQIKAHDHDTTVLLADALTTAERFEEASKLLNDTIASHKGKRSRELAVLQHRMGRLAYAAGDLQVEMAWLGVALDTDMQNGQVAAELADVAMELEQYEVALKALRAVALMKNPTPMSRAVAFLRQGQIAHTQGDPKKAAFFARKALTEDPSLADAQAFLDSIAE